MNVFGTGVAGSATSNVLQYAQMRLSPNRICEDVYGNAVIGTKLCANTVAGVSTCKVRPY